MIADPLSSGWLHVKCIVLPVREKAKSSIASGMDVICGPTSDTVPSLVCAVLPSVTEYVMESDIGVESDGVYVSWAALPLIFGICWPAAMSLTVPWSGSLTSVYFR